MRRVQSSHSIKHDTALTNGNIQSPLIKKSTSTSSLSSITNALPIDINNSNFESFNIEFVLLTNNPIQNVLTCSLEHGKFPDEILNFKNNLDYVRCIETPSEPPEQNEKIDLSSLSSVMNKSHFQLSLENAAHREKYAKWISRIRRRRRKFQNDFTDINLELEEKNNELKSKL
jgi:hypothetical protein